MEQINIAKKKALALAEAKFKFKKTNQQSSMAKLAVGPKAKEREPTQFGVSGKRNKKAEKPDELKFYKDHLPSALMVGDDEIDLSSGAPVGLRAGYDFLPTMSDKVNALKNKFGEENVRSLNISGNQNLMYKNKGKWKFFDLPFGVEFADVTSDLVGDIAPTLASVAAALPAAVSTPAGMAFAGAVAGGAVGSAQDIAARKAFGLEVKAAEVARRRSIEAVLSGGMDYGAMKAIGFVAGSVLRREGMDEAAQQLKLVEDQVKLPSIVREGEDGISQIVNSAELYKDGTAAKFLEGVRDQVNWQFVGDPVNPEPIINKFTDDIINSKLGELNKISKSVDSTLDAIDKLKAKTPGGSNVFNKKNAKKEATEVFNNLLLKETNKVAVLPESPAKLGKKLQDLVSSGYVDSEVTKKSKYNKAYDLLKDETVYGREISKIFEKQTKNAIVDAENEIISMLANPAVKMSGAAVNKLEDVANSQLSFKTLNDIIRIAESKSGAAKMGANVNEAAYAALTNDLKKLRQKVLNKSSKEGREAFEDAQSYLKDVVLKYRQGAIGSAIKTEAGSNYSEAIGLAMSNKQIKLPNRLEDPTKVILKSISNTTEAKNFLRATNNSLEARNLMRTEFLSSKGIVKDQPINKSAFDFSRQEIDVIDVLWPKKEKGGYNRKYQTLKKIQKLAETGDDFIEGLTAESIDKLSTQNTEIIEREILKLTQKEKDLRKKQTKITSNFLVKMWNKGEIPLPTNQTTMETFMSGIRSSDFREQQSFSELLKNEGKEEMFKRAVVNDLMLRVKSKSKNKQMASKGVTMWDQNSMKNTLNSERQFLLNFLGKSEYDNLVKWNNALSWVSTSKRAGPGIRVGAASGAGEKPNFFFSNLVEPIANRFKSAIIYTQLKNPIPFKILVNPEKHDKWMEKIIQSTFITDQGIEAIMNESKSDPEFKAWATEFYKDAVSQ